MVEVYNVDTNRISIVGFSRGCNPTFYTAGAYYDTFSAAVFISGRRSVEPYLSGLAKLPAVKGFWGSKDRSAYSPKSLINTINNKGGNAEFIEVPGAIHGQTPGKVFLEYRLLDWMIQQSR